jgi:integrase
VTELLLDQVAHLLRAAGQDRMEAAWLPALLWLPRGELAGLRWSDVDLDAGVARVVSQRATDAD